MGFSLDVGIPVLTVFLQGVVSFFSPCVLPLIPLYIGYLSGGTGVKGEDGRIYYKRSKVLLHTLCFVAGVSFAFFLLGLGVSALGSFFNENQMLFARAGGIIVVLFGLYQMGVFGSSSVLGNEHRLPFHLDQLAMSPITAVIMGFSFSFAWTPCVGPAMTSVLIMAASAGTKTMGFLLIGVYTLGFVIPFLAVGLFTTTVLDFFKKHMKIVKYTVRIGGILMIVMGLLMFTGKMNAVTGYLSSVSSSDEAGSGTNSKSGAEADSKTTEEDSGEKSGDSDTANSDAKDADTADSDAKDTEDTDSDDETNKDETRKLIPAVDFTLKDQFGNTHSLSDYKGKTIFLNFWATWCPPCKAEMPDIQRLYEESETEGDDAVIVLGVAAPNLGRETSEEGIKEFLEENGYTYPVLIDTDGSLFYAYGINSYPTTYMIDRDGNVYGYISGQLTSDLMESIIQQTQDGV